MAPRRSRSTATGCGHACQAMACCDTPRSACRKVVCGAARVWRVLLPDRPGTARVLGNAVSVLAHGLVGSPRCSQWLPLSVTSPGNGHGPAQVVMLAGRRNVTEQRPVVSLASARYGAALERALLADIARALLDAWICSLWLLHHSFLSWR